MQKNITALEDEMSKAEKLTYECLLKDLREAKTNERDHFLSKIERLIGLINVRINQKVITEFEHNRLDSLGTCLREAAKAADLYAQGEIVKMYIESYRWKNEKRI